MSGQCPSNGEDRPIMNRRRLAVIALSLLSLASILVLFAMQLLPIWAIVVLILAWSGGTMAAW